MQGRRNSASVIGKAQDLLKQSRRSSHVPPPATATTASNDGSELNAYLSQLSMKTSGVPSKKITAIDGLSDLSLTTDDDDEKQPPLHQSRFVKKSLSQTLINTDSSVEGLSKRRLASGKLNKTLPSSALEKAAAFTAKYSSKKKPAAAKTTVADDHSSKSSPRDENEHQKNKLKPSQKGKHTNKIANKYLQKTKVNTSTPKKKETKSAFHSVKTFSDSDDEMQAFIMNLSPVTSPDIPPIRRQQAQSPANDAAKVKENVDIKQIESNKSIAKEENKKMGVEDAAGRKIERAKQKTPEKIEQVSLASSIHTEDSEDITDEIKTERSGPSSPNVNRFALHTIDDLHLQTVDDLHLQTVDDLQTIDDLLPPTIDDLLISSPKKADSYASDFENEISTEKTISEIETERSDSTQIQEAFSDLHTESFKYSREKKSDLSSISTETHGRSSQQRKTKEQGSYSYTEDFDSYSRKSGTDSEVEEIPRDSSRTEVYSYSSYSESRTLTVTPRKAKHRHRASGVDIGTQVDVGPYQRNPDAGVPGLPPSIGLGFMDPKLVTSHIISPDALEALTGYSPSVLAMNDLLRAQLIGTQTAVQHMQHAHQHIVQSISEDYEYTTLEQTRQYLKKHRRSRLTIEEALKQVKEEMDEGYR